MNNLYIDMQADIRYHIIADEGVKAFMAIVCPVLDVEEYNLLEYEMVNEWDTASAFIHPLSFFYPWTFFYEKNHSTGYRGPPSCQIRLI